MAFCFSYTFTGTHDNVISLYRAPTGCTARWLGIFYRMHNGEQISKSPGQAFCGTPTPNCTTALPATRTAEKGGRHHDRKHDQRPGRLSGALTARGVYADCAAAYRKAHAR